MPTTTQHAPGTFCWPELATTDQEGAKKFYGALFGWESEDRDLGGGDVYTMLKLKGRDVGALYTMRKEQREQGIPPHWMSYIAVESADQAAARARQLGGKVIADPFDVFDAGRMAVFQDPTGATFSVWQAKKHIGAGVLNEIGALCWTELMTTDSERAGRFYTGLLPWKTESKTVGPPGQPIPYTMFKLGQTQAGGMMTMSPEMKGVPPHWMVYLSVADCDATLAKTKQLGGKLVAGPIDAPGAGRLAIVQDPQGAVFAFIALTRKG